MNSPVDQIKERLSIVDVIGSYIKLEPAGINMKARCPFHNERTPSFFVSPARGSFHCFGCAKGGDMFTFVQEIEGLDFSGALRLLATKAGVELTSNFSKKEVDENEVLYRILDDATTYFQNNLEEYFHGKEYLRGRGLHSETIEKFRIGYAKDEWRSLLNFLVSKKYTPEDIEKTGLIIKSEKGFYDRFRGRIMFPISDRQGKVVAFSGRMYPPTQDERVAKYVNSPETVLYNKSVILYGYDKAKQAILKNKRAVVVEGQMDLVLAHQSGTEESVAVSGTALTDQHLSLIKRFCDVLILCFDSDNAGVNAVSKSTEKALMQGFDVRAVHLPLGMDPADMIKEKPEEWKKLLLNSTHVIDFFLDVIIEKEKDLRIVRREVSQKILPYIAKISDRIDRAHFIQEVAKKIGLASDVITQEVDRIGRGVIAPSESIKKIDSPPERSRIDVFKDEVAGIFLANQSVEGLDLEAEKKYLEEAIEIPYEEFMESIPSPKRGTLALQAEIMISDPHRIQEALHELIHNIYKERLRLAYEHTKKELSEAELSKDEETIKKLLNECHILLQKIHSIS
jgi:DNA primase